VRTRDTVIFPTPAKRATSAIVALRWIMSAFLFLFFNVFLAAAAKSSM
jgi:hypothetical protein